MYHYYYVNNNQTLNLAFIMKSIQKSMLNSLASVAHSMWATLKARLRQ